jgi:outer membrane receptor protein involved in Fe transport
VGNGLLGSLQVNVSHTGDHYLTVFNDDFEKQSYTLVGMSAGIRSETLGWSVSLYGQNLSNEIYATNYFGDGGVFISQPRLYGVRLSYDF